jgi:hypothetical protein
MSFCGDKKINLIGVCISIEDYYMIILNITILAAIAISIYIQIKKRKEKLNKTVNVKHNFTILGEGPLNLFYSTSIVQQKSNISRKKVTNKLTNTVTDKNISNNELKCNNCNRTVDLSYQYTLPKLQSNN